MRTWTAKLRNATAGISLRPATAIVLFFDLSLPIAFTGSQDLAERREQLLAQLAADHTRIVKVLVIDMQVASPSHAAFPEQTGGSDEAVAAIDQGNDTRVDLDQRTWVQFATALSLDQCQLGNVG